MKKIILSLLIIGTFISCSGLRDDLNDMFTKDIDFNWEYPGKQVIEISDLREATWDLEYISDDTYDNWQLPDETWERGGGDCEDLSSTSAFILKSEMGLNVELAVLRLKTTGAWHMTIMIDKQLYVYFGFQYDHPEYDLMYTMTFDEYVDKTANRSISLEEFGGKLGPELAKIYENRKE